MRIQCPACTAIYNVADSLLDPPRTVRCAGCQNDWLATPMAAAEPPPPVFNPHEHEVEEAQNDVSFHEEPEPSGGIPAAANDQSAVMSALERLAVPGESPPVQRPRDWLLTSAWAASFVLLAGLGVAGYAGRDQLMQQWPASKRVYATLGLTNPDDKPAGDKTLRPMSQ